MFIKLSTFLTISLITINLFADQTFQPTSKTSYFEEGAKVYIFGGRVNVRKGAGTKHSVVFKLQEGSKVEIVKMLDDLVKIDAFVDHWYKIKTEDGKSGYLFGAFLTMHAAKGSSDHVIMVGGSSKGLAEIRVVQKGKLISSKQLPKTSEDYISVSKITKDFKAPGHHILMLMLSTGESFPIGYTYQLYTINKKKITLIHEKDGGADPPVSQTFVYKFIKQSKTSQIIEELEEVVEDEDKAGKPIYGQRIKRQYQLKGDKLMLIKEEKLK